MENIYAAYTKNVNNETMYFVKRFSSFPDIAGSPSILADYGMHKKFHKACFIARISDKIIIDQLAAQVNLSPVPEPGKLISFKPSKHNAHSFLKNTQHFLSKFRLAGFN